MSHGRCGYEKIDIPGVQRSPFREDKTAETEMGRSGGPGAVGDHGACEGDDPGTWEALVSLGNNRCHGDPVTNLRRVRCRPRAQRTGRARRSFAKNERAGPSNAAYKGRPEQVAYGDKGVGGPHRSDEGG